MSRIFVERPIFAWVLAIIIMMGGIGAIIALPIAQYPDVAPTQISIRATYPGASAETLENSVTQVLERELTGLEGLLYFNSSSSSRGAVTVTATFDKGVNADIARSRSRIRSRRRFPGFRPRFSSRAFASLRRRPTS